MGGNKIGILDTKGVLHECESFEHLDLAYEIVEEDQMLDHIKNRLKAEEYLQSLGWICIRARDVYGMIGYLKDPGSGREERIHLTDKQKKWLEDNYEDFPEEKQRSVDDMLDRDKY